MIGASTRNLCIAMITMVLMTPLQAVEIRYNEQNRPVEFIDLQIGGQSWHVFVTWGGTMANAYGVNGVFVETTLYGDDAADDAAAAMQQALLDDNYTGTVIASYLRVPKSYHSTGHFYMGPGVYLHQAGLPIARVDVGFNNRYGTVGFTRIRLFEDSFED